MRKYAVLLLTLLTLLSCRGLKDKTVYYDVRVILQDIFTLAELEGSITINGQSGRSGATFRIENGKIVRV